MKGHVRITWILPTLFSWIAKNPHRQAMVIGTVSGAVNIALGLIGLGLISAPFLALPVGFFAGGTVFKDPRFTVRTGVAGAVAGIASGLFLMLGSCLSGVVFATIASWIDSSSAPSSNPNGQPWSPQLYLTFTLVGLFFGICAFFECIVVASIAGAIGGWRNRPLPTLPVIYE